MAITIVHNGRLITPLAGTAATGHVLIENGRVAGIGPGALLDVPDATYIDAAGGFIGPGFIDVHVHGADGHDAMDATPEALHAIARYKARHGVTGFLPATMTDAGDAIRAALANIGACEGAVDDGAAILGAHIEGPYFSVEQKGAQPGAYIRRAAPQEYEAWFDLCTVGVFSVAVEYPEHLPLVAYARQRGAAASVGHSGASYEQVLNALPWGLNHVTHTYNGMSGLHHRTPGVALAALAVPDLYAEIICDMHHVHPAMVDLAVKSKTPARAVLITDAIRATGLPDGEYMLGKQTAIVRDGLPRTPEGSLAGSSLTMDAALRNVLGATGVSLAEAWRMASLTPAESIGIDGRKGSLAVGKDADLVVLDEYLEVVLTMVKGKVVYRRA
ncbi:MAG: N-acetylglucosamine-6-phosphate deacetylase [Anaerolineae bacterium]|nr:N-acetylglucosamine-6-phosphate deacetylase [Anaerolineae bacterium]